jgi:hypothetical protein
MSRQSEICVSVEGQQRDSVLHDRSVSLVYTAYKTILGLPYKVHRLVASVVASH